MGWRDEFGRLSGRTIPEQWDRGNAVHQVQCMVMTMRDALESRYGVRLECSNHLVPWMVMHAAAILSMFKVGKDGNSLHEQGNG